MIQSLLAAANHIIPTNGGDDVYAGLVRFHAALDEQLPDIPDRSLTALRLETARRALRLVHRVQLLLDTQDPPPIGTRDLSVLRALLTLLFRWGINPSLARLQPLWRTNLSASLSDLTTLSTLLSDVMSTLFPHGVREQPPQTLVTTTILRNHVPNLLNAAVAVGWLPKSLWPQGDLSLHTLRPSVLRLLEFLPLSQVMTDLGAVLSSTPPPPSHVRKVCSSLLTTSLLHPAGIQALFAAVFGELDGPDDPPLEKYERTAGILMAIPAGHKPEEYFAIMIPRLMKSLSNSVPATYRRAASFAVSRMLDPGFSYRPLVFSLVSPIIHLPIIHGAKAESPETNHVDHPFAATSPPTPTTALSMLTILSLNTDPSPAFITDVLSPVIPALYALKFHLDTVRTSDPVLKESVKGLLATWGRVVETQDGINTLWSIIRSERIYWQMDISGNIKHGEPDMSGKPALLTPGDISKAEEIVGDNLLDLYPDPAHFVQYIKSLDRQDMASELFVGLLEVYHSIDTEQDADPMRGLLYLQTIVQMQTQLTDYSSPSNILRKPEHILLFVKHALESQAAHDTSSTFQKARHSRGLGLEDLKIVDDIDNLGDDDSDDEAGELGSDQAENSMAGTAIDLLLAILEANTGLSARNAPVLNEIFSLLEPFSNDTSELIRGLAREARMVMTARLAPGSTSWSTSQKREDAQEIYQKALKLLQDPILPVRAHGLLLLRQLVSSRPGVSESTTDTALVPAIMSIFMQSVQDDDSYIFLNAVQGLSAMVDAFGKGVLGNLLETYTRNLSASSVGTLSKQEVDSKVRVGEALGQVIRRCGDALGIYADIIVPQLISVFRSSYAPTVLRTSALSLLTQCVKTSAVSVLRYTDDLATGMIDLFQVEMVSTVQSPPKDGDVEACKVGQRGEIEVLDSKPTAVDPKLPPLRRAALHFWTSLLDQLTLATYDGTAVEGLPATLLRRAKVTLEYIALTDEDAIVRAMAREANEAIDQLNKATLGI